MNTYLIDLQHKLASLSMAGNPQQQSSPDTELPSPYSISKEGTPLMDATLHLVVDQVDQATESSRPRKVLPSTSTNWDGIVETAFAWRASVAVESQGAKFESFDERSAGCGKSADPDVISARFRRRWTTTTSIGQQERKGQSDGSASPLAFCGATQKAKSFVSSFAKLETKSNPISECITLLHFFFFSSESKLLGEKKGQKRGRYIGCFVSALQIFRFIFHWRCTPAGNLSHWGPRRCDPMLWRHSKQFRNEPP